MGNFEKLSVLVIVVIIVMILVVAIYTWTDNPDNSATAGPEAAVIDIDGKDRPIFPGPINPVDPKKVDDPWPGLFPEPEVDPVPEPVVKTDPEPKPVEPKKAGSDHPTTDLTATEPWTYTIKAGDSLSVVAQRELGTIHRQGEIEDLNPGLDSRRLRIGQELKMPPRGAIGTAPIKASGPKTAGGETTPATSTGAPKPGSTYVTRRGDTLEKISKAAFGSIDYWPEIWAKNLKALPRLEDMGPGLRLSIPKVKKFH